MRNFSVIASVILLALAGSPLAAQIDKPLSPVQTGSGSVRGQFLPSGVKAWLGIHYATPPIGGLRWRPPQPMHWNGVWTADRFGPECIQFLRPHNINQYYGEEATSEDCLTLNIWAPAGKAAKLPVIVFIHGGGSTTGSGSMPNYNGENLAKRGAVVVTFNYRLGLFGSIAHPDLTKEQGGHSGNYGYLDQVAAFQWVHDNIARFGGDPSHVVMYGQSSGGISVFLHLFSPLSRGLFSAAMLTSPCCGFRETSLADGEKIGLALQTALGAADLAAMRNAPADKVLAQQGENQNLANHPGLRGANLIDGLFMPRSYAAALQAHDFAHVPLVFTSNAKDNDWGRNPLVDVRTVADYKAAVTKVYGDKAGQFLALYPVATDADVPAMAARVIQDGGMQADGRNCAAMFHQNESKGPDVYLGLYDHSEPFVPDVHYADRDPATAGAYHNSDSAYWFGAYEATNLLRTTRRFTDADRAMSAAMSDMLIAFARTGNPSTPAVAWPAWSASDEQRLVIDRKMRVEKLDVQGMAWLEANPLARAPSLPCGTAAN